MATCETCGGRKKIVIRTNKGAETITCPECHGSGHVPDKRK